MTFNSIRQIEDVMDCYGGSVIQEPVHCDHCGNLLTDYCGYSCYYHLEDYMEERFCDEQCAKEYLMQRIEGDKYE